MDVTTNERIASVEAMLPTLATRADIAELRADLHKSMAEVHKWALATAIGLFIGFSGMFFAVTNTLKPAAPVAAVQPR